MKFINKIFLLGCLGVYGLNGAGFNLNIVNKSTKTIWVQSQKDVRVGYNYTPGSLIPVNSNMTQTLYSEVPSVPYYFFYSNASKAPSMAQITFDSTGFTASSNPIGFPIKTNYIYKFDNTKLVQKPSDFTIYISDPKCSYTSASAVWDYNVDGAGNASGFTCVTPPIANGHFNFINNTADTISITKFNSGAGSCTPGLPQGIQPGNSASFDAWCPINTNGSIEFTPVGGKAQSIDLKKLNTDTYFQIKFDKSSSIVTLNSGTDGKTYSNLVTSVAYTPAPLSALNPNFTTGSINGKFKYQNDTNDKITIKSITNCSPWMPMLNPGDAPSTDYWGCSFTSPISTITYTTSKDGSASNTIRKITFSNLFSTDKDFRIRFADRVYLESGPVGTGVASDANKTIAWPRILASTVYPAS
ncbi:MAG: hypothetical protein P4L22_01850 [Candidatus Babeliales bacterium]|nr:hypothetical protein [Candidatus Babeliales bacterium]